LKLNKGGFMSESKKFEILAIRLKSEHKIEIIQYAELEGLSMSSWVRRVVINEIMKKRGEYANKTELSRN